MELMPEDRLVLRTSICLGIYTLVTRLDLLTIAASDDVVPVRKKRQAIIPTNRLMAKFSSCLNRLLKTKYKTKASNKGLRIDQKKPSVVF